MAKRFGVIAIRSATNRNLIDINWLSSTAKRTNRQEQATVQGNRVESDQIEAPRADSCAGYYPAGGSHLLRGRNTNDEQIKVYRDTIQPTKAYWERGIYICVPIGRF